MSSPNSPESESAKNPVDLTGPWNPQTLASASDSTGAGRDEPLPAGHAPRVPGYELLGILGRGGMGVVYRARQTPLNRIVALKMILSARDRAEPKELIRFLAEAEAVAAVKHPHVVQVHEYGDAEGRPFLALEYLPGGSLADRLKFRGRLDPVGAAQLVGKIAHGVQAVHNCGIVHRDLKPANVLFDGAEEPKVTDFGLAKRDNHNDLTAPQAVMGTPAYMSPEQATGGTKFVGPAADVYSLGVILYQCLTGTRPFEDTDPISLLRKVAEEEPDRPRKRLPGLPDDIELICLKCLAKSPHERYPTAEALADDLAHFAAGEPVSVRAAGMIERTTKWARRKPTLAAAYGLTAVSLLLLGLVAGAVWLWQRTEVARELAVRAKVEAEDARDGETTARGVAEVQKSAAQANATRADEQKRIADANAQQADANAKQADAERTRAERIKYALDMNAATQAWQDGQIGRMETILKSYVPEKNQPEFRSFEWHYLWRQLQQARPRFAAGPAVGMATFRLSPDGTRFTLSSPVGNQVWDLAKGARLIYFPRANPQAEFDQVARRPAAAMYPEAFIPIPGEELARASHTELSADSERFYYIGDKGSFLAALKLGGGPPARLWQRPLGGGGISSRLTASPRGGWVAASGETLRVFDASTGAEKWSLPVADFRSPGSGTPYFTPDDKELLVVNIFTRTVIGFDAATGEKRRQIDMGTVLPGGMLSCSPDSRRIAVVMNGGEVRVWNLQTGQLERSIRAAGAITQIAFSPQPPHNLATAGEDGVIRVWDPVVGQPLAVHRGHRARITQIAFQSQAPHALVSLSEDGGVFVWEAGIETQMVTFAGWTGEPTHLGFSPDSRRVFGIAIDSGNVGFGSQPVAQATRVWDWDLGSAEVVVREVGKPAISPVASCTDTFRRIAVGSIGQPLRVLNADTHTEIGAFGPVTLGFSGWYRGQTGGAVLSADGTRLAQVVGEKPSQELVVWDVDRHAVLHRKADATALAFSSDGSRLAVYLGTTGAVSVVDLATGTTSPGIRSTTSCVAFAPDGKRFLLQATPDTLGIWDAETGKLLHRLAGHSGRPEAAGFSPDGRTLVSFGSDGTLRFWDTGTGQQTMSLPLPHYTSSQFMVVPRTISFSADGRVLGMINQGALVLDARPPEVPATKPPQWITMNSLRKPIPRIDFAAQVDSLPQSLVQTLEMLKKMEADRLAKEPPKPLQLPVHTGPVTALGFNRDGTRLVTGDAKLARIWDAKTGQELFKLDTPAPVRRAQFGPGESLLTAFDLESSVRLHSVATGERTGLLLPAGGGGLREAAFTPVGNQVVAVHTTGVVTVFGGDRKPVKSFAAFDAKSTVNAMALSPDGKKACIASGTMSDWGGKTWNLETGQEGVSWKADAVHAVAWSGDGKWIASAEGNQNVVVRSANTGRPHKTLAVNAGSRFAASAVAITHDGSQIAVVCLDGAVEVWDVNAAKATLSAVLDATAIGAGGVVFSPDGKRIAASAPGVVRVWDLVRTELAPVAVPPKGAGENSPLDITPHTGTVVALGFNSDGARLVTGDAKLARVWDANSGKEQFTLDTPGTQFRAAFSSTGRVLTLSNSESVVRLWDAVTGKPLPALPALEGVVREAVFTPDGKQVVCADSSGAITVFDLASGKLLSSVAAFDPKLILNGFAISPDGSKVCFGLGKSPDWSVTIWGLEKSKVVLSTPTQEKAVWAVAWSGDGKWIASGGLDQTVRVWHADTGKLHKTLTGPEKTVARVAITHDGGRVAATCFDGIVRVWDVGTGKVVKSFKFENPGTGNVAFSPDGKRLAASAPGVVRVWDLPKPPSP